MKSDKEIFYKNRGVERNKTPLKNKVYWVEVSKLKDNVDLEEWEPYKYEDGYLILLWAYQNDDHRNWHGPVTPDELKELLGNQWSKFRQGRREFIIQRRFDGKNIKK